MNEVDNRTSNMNDRFDIILKNQDEHAKAIVEIRDALLGTKYAPTGIIHRVNAHDDYIDKQKIEKAKIVGALGTISLLITVVGNFIMKIILD